MSLFRNTIFAVGFMAIGAVGSVGAQAVARPGGGGHGPGMHLARLIQKLDLTETQQEQADEIRDVMRDHRSQKRDDREAARERLIEVLGSAEIDRDEVHAELDARAADQVAFMHDMADRLMDLHATLDDVQRATLVEAIEDGAERLEERRSGRSGPGGADGEGGPGGF